MASPRWLHSRPFEKSDLLQFYRVRKCLENYNLLDAPCKKNAIHFQHKMFATRKRVAEEKEMDRSFYDTELEEFELKHDPMEEMKYEKNLAGQF